MKVRICITVDDNTLAEFRSVCKSQQLDMSTVINELMKFFVDNKEKIDEAKTQVHK